MKSYFLFQRLLSVVVASVLLTGCFLKPARVSTRYFMLAPISTNELASGVMPHLSVKVEPVKMPPYLRRDSMVIRNDANEITYMEDAVWAERPDQSFQRTLAANLSRLLPADTGRDQAAVKLFINVQQFDVDTRGRGTLIAEWWIITPNNDKPLKSSRSRLVRQGTAPGGNPEVIAAILSDLTAQFSRELAQSIRESANSSR